MTTDGPRKIVSILLAAGESTRMGQVKALLQWEQGTLLEFQIAELAVSGVKENIVVLGAHEERLRPLADKFRSARPVYNPDYRDGKTTSIKAGLRALGEQEADILIVAVDQPRPAEIVEALIDLHRASGAAITVPVHDGRRGHPLLFRHDVLPDLLAITEETLGLRAVVEKWRGETTELAVDSRVVLLDLNSPDQYDEARELFGWDDDHIH